MPEFDDTPVVSPEELADTEPKPAARKKHGVALCLSGGGYRAALFHLGVLRCLHEMGILQSVRTISSVSGGSIISSYLARRMREKNLTNGVQFEDWESEIASGFRDFVKKDIRTGPALLHLLWNWKHPKWRVRHLQWNYDRFLLRVTENGKCRSVTLGDLPDAPQFVYCATDLTFGVNWEFKKGRTGDFQAGYCRKDDWQLAKAVAASSCFPPVFGPLKLDLDPGEFKKGRYRDDDRNLLVRELMVTDGGVYDNIGFEPVKGHAVIIASDGGSPFGYMGSAGIVKRLMRFLPVMMNQVASLRKRIFFTGITEERHQGVYIDISHERTTAAPEGAFDGYANQTVRNLIARIRTDLDKFSDDEARILENHGYFEAYRRITSKLPELVANKNYKPVTPHSNVISDERVLQALKNSSRRKFLLFRI